MAKSRKKKARSSSSKSQRASRGRGSSPERELAAIERIVAANGTIRYYVAGDLESGQVHFLLTKFPTDGKGAIINVLVDTGITGVKDVWSQVPVHAEVLEGMRTMLNTGGMSIRPTTLEESRRWILGGLRWASEHDMRLPRLWPHAARILGVGEDDWKTASTDGFYKEFAGHPEDLRLRLVKGSFDELIQRPDIEFLFDERAPYLADHETGEYSSRTGAMELGPSAGELSDEEAFARMTKEVRELREWYGRVAKHLTAAVAEDLRRGGVEPSPELPQYITNHLIAVHLARLADSTATTPQDMNERYDDFMDVLDKTVPDEQWDDFEEAGTQMEEHFEKCPDIMAFIDAASAKAKEELDQSGTQERRPRASKPRSRRPRGRR